MKNAITNYENTFYLKGAALSGVTSVDGSYNVDYKPINTIGKGFNKQVMASVPTAELSVSRYLTNNDPAFNLTGDGSSYTAKSVNGGLYYQNKYFSFQKGYLSSIGINCSVGEVPTIETSFDIFGDIGPGFNPSGTSYAGGVFVPQVKNITLTCKNSSTNRVKDFKVDFSTPKQAIYALSETNSQLPVEVHNAFPIEITSNFTLEIDDYETKTAFQDLTSNGETNFDIRISGTILLDTPLTLSSGNDVPFHASSGSTSEYILNAYEKNIEDAVPIFNFSVSDAIIVSERINSSSEDLLSVNLSYKAYLN
jgi:hypothetical protein